MKIFGVILKIIGALAAIAAIAFVVVRYGDKIVAWTKKTLSSFGCNCFQASSQEIIVEEDAVTEDNTPAQEDAVQAEETDFEG